MEGVSSLGSPTRRSLHSVKILSLNFFLASVIHTSITAILIYRLILDLQEANTRNVKVGSDDPELQTSQGSQGSQSSLSFVDRAIGSLGATIRPGAAPAREEWDEWDEPEDVGLPDEPDSRSDDAYLAGHRDAPIALDDLAVHAPSEPDLEIQEVPCEERNGP